MTEDATSASVPEALPETLQYRPALHFTPAAHWINDPNGLIHHQGVWHLFYQYHPHSSVWGPMHWGHATSTDLLHWRDHGIALAPGDGGMAFSGSIVIDTHDSAGFAREGRDGRTPLVAIFTQHPDQASGDCDSRRESQGLAYSLDDGQTWTLHTGNPVLPNPGTQDFRDPKVRWLPEQQRWLMSLAVGDHVSFYTSPDLKHWEHASDFGAGIGAHDGVWECPDLFPLHLEGSTHWVLLVSLVQGGPNGGSATQYFVGQFDGRCFHAEPGPTHWLDHGPDNYAGVTWNNAPDGRTVLIGWMNNWDYARQLPTSPWRGAMTLPRDLHLRRVGTQTVLAGMPCREALAHLSVLLVEWQDESVSPQRNVDADLCLLQRRAGRPPGGAFMLLLRLDRAAGFVLEFSSGTPADSSLLIGHDSGAGHYFIDRRRSGIVDFHPLFASRCIAPRCGDQPGIELLVHIDACSVELFADGGSRVMTALAFPGAPLTAFHLQVFEPTVLKNLQVFAAGDSHGWLAGTPADE